MDQYENTRLRETIQQFETYSEVSLEAKELIDRDMEIVIKEAIINKKCKKLYLLSNRFTSVGVSILAEALNNNNILEELSLSDNQISDNGLYFLVKTFSTNTNMLKKLYIGNNGITDEGIKYLSQMIKTNKTLTHLDLHGNEITDDGVRLLTKTIESSNRIIELLDLSENKFLTDSSIDSLIHMIKYNHTLQYLYIYKCNLSLKGKERLKNFQQSKKTCMIFT